MSQTGEQAVNVARNAVLAAGWPEDVVGMTIDRQCGSSQQAVHFAAAGVIAGHYDIAVAGGVESMTPRPDAVTFTQGPGVPFGPRDAGPLPDGGLVPQGVSAEIDRRALGPVAHRRWTRSPCARTRARPRPREAGAFDAGARPGRRRRRPTRASGPGRTLDTLAGLRTAFK